MMKYEILEYTENGKSPFAKWFNKLKPLPAVRVDKYIRRMEQGNLGNSKSLRDGVRELRIDYGPGYRVYFGIDRGKIIILLAGGDKRRQSKDIQDAKLRWRCYKEGLQK